MFDVVYCRGVLMHIPDWEMATRNLCRVLKWGGRIVIMESNHRSLETLVVLLVRRIMKRKSNIIKKRGGIEFWSTHDGHPFLVRISHMENLSQWLKACKVWTIQRNASEFWDANRFPPGLIRNVAIRFNQAWVFLRLPAYISSGNYIIGEKSFE